jgi:hypothetical protein
MAKLFLSGIGSNSRERRMSFLVKMAPTLIHGNRHDRARALGAIGVRFALGAFAVACIQHYADPYVSMNLDSQLAPVVGGAMAAAIGAFLKSV